MRPIGFSTGTISLGNWREALALLNDSQANAIELSALREHELEPLLEALPKLDLSCQYSNVFIHAPGALEFISESSLVEKLSSLAPKRWPIIVHPDIINDYDLWNSLGDLICIENMDRRKNKGKTVSELKRIFSCLESASFCFDVGHARHIDRSMSQAETMLKEFGDRLKVIHLSEVDFYGNHTSLSLMGMLSISQVAKHFPEDCPIILECRTADNIDDDIAHVRDFLSCSSRFMAHVI